MSVTSTFREVRFPAEISYGSKGGVSFNTTIFEATSGIEQRNINWSKGRGKWDVSHGIKTRDQMNELIAFFTVMQGKAYSFRFKDWGDFYLTNQKIGTGDGSNKNFQLIKSYQVGSFKYDRTIKKPVAGTIAGVLVGGVPTAGTLNTTTGVLSFGTAPTNGADVVVGYCEFDVPARFDTDKMEVAHDFWETMSWSSIPVVEVRL